LGGGARDIVFALIEHIVWHEGQEPAIASPPSHCHTKGGYNLAQDYRRQEPRTKTHIGKMFGTKEVATASGPSGVYRDFEATANPMLATFCPYIYKQAHHIPQSRFALHFFNTGGFIVDCFHCAKEDRDSLDFPNSAGSTKVLKYNSSFTLMSSPVMPSLSHIDKLEMSAPNPPCRACSGISVMLPRGNG
jgi:hypothetical protein